jgi:hypothetical protein
MTAQETALFVLARIATGRHEDGRDLTPDAAVVLAQIAINAMRDAGDLPFGLEQYMRTGELHPAIKWVN